MSAQTSSFDVIVVGAGTAGIPCAVAAAEAGASVLLVDKAEDIGGTLHVSSAQMSAGGTKRQEARGIADSPDRHYDDVMTLSRDTARKDLVRLAVDQAPSTIEYLDERGIDWAPDCPKILYFHPPYSVPRTVWGQRGGISILEVLRKDLATWTDSGAIELRLGAEVKHLTLAGDGAVTGVELRSGTTVERVQANATVLATGGYAANPKLFAELHDRPLYSGAWPTSTGDGIILAREAGGEVVNAEMWLPAFGCLPGPEEDWRLAWRDRSTLYVQLRDQWEIYVLRDGQRFIAEDEPSVDLKEQALAAVRDQTFFQVFDEHTLENGPQMLNFCTNDELRGLVGKRRGVFAAASLDELAASTGIDADQLVRTVYEYNQVVARGSGDPLGRTFLPAPIAKPPYYALQNHGMHLIGFAGVDVDANLAVRRGDDIVDGLYALGEVLGIGATSGNAVCGGMLVTPALSFGQWLGARLGASKGKRVD